MTSAALIGMRTDFMASTVATSAAESHRKGLENVAVRMAKADLKNLEKPWRQQVGGAVKRMLAIAGLTQKEGWALLGHTDGAQLSRWIAGTERPQFDTIFAVQDLRQPLVLALCELAGAGVEIETTVRIRRSA